MVLWVQLQLLAFGVAVALLVAEVGSLVVAFLNCMGSEPVLFATCLSIAHFV